jgi:hypothetical protein
MATLRDVGGGHGLATGSRKAIAAASAVGLITVSRTGTDDASRRDAYFRGGVALQRIWLTATKLGLAFQPMTPLVYLFARLEQGQGEGLDEREKTELRELRRRYREALALTDAPIEVMLFRLANAGPPTARSLRRNVIEMLTVD